MRVSFICPLLLIETWVSFHGVLASPYHKYGIQDGGGVAFTGGSELHTFSRYPKYGQQFKSQPILSSHQSTSSKGFNGEQLKRFSGNYGTAALFPTYEHPSRSLKQPTVSLKENKLQGSGKGLKNIFAPEHVLFRSEPGGFTQNAPGSLYISHPAENEVNVPTVHTVPYHSIYRKRPGRFARRPVIRQPSQHIAAAYASPNAIPETTPQAVYFKHGFSNVIEEPSAPPQGLMFSNGLPGENAISLSSDEQMPQESVLRPHDSNQPSGSEYELSFPQQEAYVQTFPETLNTRQVENEATTGEGQPTSQLQEPIQYVPPQSSQDMVAEPLPIGNNGYSSGNGRETKDSQAQSQPSGIGLNANADGKQLKFKAKKRYLVRAFNQYEHGRIYQSHGSNDPSEFPFPGDTLRIRIHDYEEPGNEQTETTKDAVMT